MSLNQKHRDWSTLPKYSQDLYKEVYFLPNENYDGWLKRVSRAYADDVAHAMRISNYIRKRWFHPSTPISSNAGVPERGLPISCYTNEVEDSKKGIFDVWHENNWLGSYGGGIGTGWSRVREMDAKVGDSGKSSGVIPFLKVSDSTTLAVSQGGLRRASQAAYLHISHPEILKFLGIRRPTGDIDRTTQNLHHGIVLSDEFMFHVEDRLPWNLISPKTGEVVDTVDAFDLFKKILITRMETGEPYILFEDNANNANPEEYKFLGRKVKTSNLCSEIMLHTDKKTTGVCCLTSVNLEHFDEWVDEELFLEDIHRYTDNVLQSFIDLTEDKEGFQKARKGAIAERSIGIGVMGYHSYLQSVELPYGSLSAIYLTEKMFTHISKELEKSNRKLALEKGSALLSDDKRNVHVTAVAPTASISTLAGLSSPGIDPRVSNIYTAKSNLGSYTIKNKYLEAHLEELGKNTEEVWKDILKHEGSVQHLDFLHPEVKEVYKTAYEINPMLYTASVAKMVPHITQGISTNLFLPANVHVKLLYDVHIDAWKRGLKSLYYLRSKALNRATTENINRIALEADTCLGCA